MAERSSLKLLKLLDKKENDKFKTYLLSPYFNKNEVLVEVYEEIQNYLKQNNELEFDTYILLELGRKKINLSLPSLEKHLSNLYKHCLDFFAVEYLRTQPFQKELSTLQILLNKKDKGHFEKILKKTYGQLKKQKDSIKKFKLINEITEIETSFVSTFKDKRNNDINLNEKSEALNNYFFAQKLFVINLNVIRNHITNNDFDIDKMNRFVALLESLNIKNQPLIKCYLLSFKVLTSKQKRKHFELLVKTLENNLEQITSNEVFNLYAFIQNLTPLVYTDKKESYNFMFLLYKKMIANNFIYHNNKILVGIFKNIVNIAIKQKELTWLEEFIESHRNKISPENVQEDVYNYSLARLNFFKNDYEKTQNLIINLNFKDIYYKISVKRLELMLYFEMKEWLLLDSLIGAFRVSLIPKRTETIPKIHVDYNLNFIKNFGKLYSIFNQPNINLDKAKNLKSDINALTEISEKDWFLEKLTP